MDNRESKNVVNVMKDSFINYAMDVIIARALPDLRDGLKPVHRRILYTMYEDGLTPDKAFRKSATTVGAVLGKYHPHGDTSVYDAMVRMAQDFSYRHPLVDGHGNFGSVDGYGAAAYRYTEARLSKISNELLRDIQKETVDWMDNYDGEEKEPVVLPCKFPNLLVNGTTGIAVGMATNMPPHNLNEAVDAIIAIMENPDISVMELMDNYISGPDFPTGGYILGRSGIKQAYETGKGTIITRAKTHVETLSNGKPVIYVDEIPYMVNKAQLVEKIAQLSRDREIEGITDLRDESNLNGIKIVIELRKDVQPEVILNQLYRLTSMQTTFGVNNVVLVNNAPKLVGLKELLQRYVDHQVDVTVRKTKYELNKAKDRAHILEGLRIAIDHVDEIIEIVKTSRDTNEACNTLMDRFGLSEIQARAILDMQIKRLTGLERDKIEEEYRQLVALIKDLEDILANYSRIVEIIKNDLIEVKNKYGDNRRTQIIEADIEMEDEDLIPVEDITITMTTNGYIKRITSDTYRVQNRGGKGIKGMTINEDDVIYQFINMVSHDYLMIFTNFGKVYRIKGYQVPSSGRTSKGIPIVNLLNLDKNEKVKALVPITRDEHNFKYLFFVTKNGLVKRVPLCEFDNIRQSGKIAITLKDEDELFMVKPTTGDDEIIIAGANGKAVRFNENDVREMGRNAIGIKGFNIDGSEVVGVATDNEGKLILSITENGYGKKSELEEYRLTSRGAKGVKTINITEKNGKLVSLLAVNGDEDCMIITSDGLVIRISLKQVSVYKRQTQGVKLISLQDDSKVSTVALVYENPNDKEDTIEEEESTEK